MLVAPTRFFRINRNLLLPVLILLAVSTYAVRVDAQTTPLTHAAVRPWPKPSTRPMAEHAGYFVDPRNGNDTNNGTTQAPWQTVQHALTQVHAGDTLYLRAGTYREQLTVSLSGREDAPITIRSYPGELAIIDGSIREFFDTPADAWEPVSDGLKDEYQSKHAYANVRDIIGAFGDCMVGLQTYWPVTDFRATNEFWDETPGQDVNPVYCGPGLWYDQESGYIHIRLAHTHLQGPSADNYEGETDPQKVPLVLSTFRAVPLRVDQGKHIRFQDLIIRGGGFDTVVLDHADNIEFDHVTVYCGTYGMRCSTTTRLKFYRSALYGNTPPWGFRTENSLRSRKGTARDIARLTGHALWVTDTGLEFSVYAFPPNDSWEISYSTFTDSHDGLYLGGINTRFHHNRLDNMQDDGIYVSPVYAYARGKLQIYQNLITRTLTALAFGGPVTDVKGCDLAVYRNVFDLTGAVRYERPSTAKPVIETVGGRVVGDHGSPPWPVFDFYQNTVTVSSSPRNASMALVNSVVPERPRRILNNLLLTSGKMPAYTSLTDPVSLDAGNLYWGSNLDEKLAAGYFDKYRKSEEFKKSLAANKVGSSTKSIAARPLFVNADAGDYRPAAGSPVVNAGIDLPSDLPDPLRSADAGAPDIGALPLNGEPLQTGVDAP